MAFRRCTQLVLKDHLSPFIQHAIPTPAIPKIQPHSVFLLRKDSGLLACHSDTLRHSRSPYLLRLERVVTGSLSHPACRPAFSSHLVSSVWLRYTSRCRFSMRSFQIYFLTLVAIAPGAPRCRAQEVVSIDVTNLVRKELRRPAAAPGTKHQGGIDADYHCPSAKSDAGALQTELVSVDRPGYSAGDLLTFEVTVENVGSKSLKIPVSPDLADLQLEDPAEQFGYSEFTLTLWDALSDKSSLGLVAVRLYGNDDQANTTMKLLPGQWVRIRGKDRINIPREGVERIHFSAITHSYLQAILYHCETQMTATSMATACREICIRQARRESFPITLTAPEQ